MSREDRYEGLGYREMIAWSARLAEGGARPKDETRETLSRMAGVIRNVEADLQGVIAQRTAMALAGALDVTVETTNDGTGTVFTPALLTSGGAGLLDPPGANNSRMPLPKSTE